MPGSSEVRLQVHNNDVDTVHKGVMERIIFHKVNGEFVRPTQPDGDALLLLLPVRRAILANMPSVTRFSCDEFLNSYSGRRRIRYEQAIESLQWEEVSERDAKIPAFRKNEFFNLGVKGPEAPCRIIQPRDPRYNVELGRYLKPLEKPLFKAIDRVFGMKTVMKGLNADTRGAAIAKAWGMFEAPIAIGLDASRFDQHVSAAMLRFEHSFYTSCFPGVRHLAKLLKMQIWNKGMVRLANGTLAYMVKAHRASGDKYLNWQCSAHVCDDVRIQRALWREFRTYQ
jgi:hypothetical protein